MGSSESGERRRGPIRRGFRFLAWILAFVVLGSFMIDAFVRQVLYPMPAVAVPLAPQPLREIRLETSEGDTVIGWYGSGDEADVGAARRTQVVFLHGNGENLATLYQAGLFEDFRRLGAGVVAIDYPGYGRSGGKPSERANVAAALAACDWLAGHRPDAPRVVMGWSLGAAVAAQVVRRPSAGLDAVILASAWDQLGSVARDHFPDLLVRLAIRGDYDSVAALRGVEVPVLMIHGERDELVATRHGRALRDSLEGGGRDVTWVEVAGAGHNDLMGRREVWRAVAGLTDALER